MINTLNNWLQAIYYDIELCYPHIHATDFIYLKYEHALQLTA